MAKPATIYEKNDSDLVEAAAYLPWRRQLLLVPHGTALAAMDQPVLTLRPCVFQPIITLEQNLTEKVKYDCEI